MGWLCVGVKSLRAYNTAPRLTPPSPAGDRVLSCTVDVFSCKRAGTDKKTGFSIQQRLQEECDMRIAHEFPEGGGGNKRKKSGDSEGSTPSVTMTELGELRGSGGKGGEATSERGKGSGIVLLALC